MGIQGDTDVGPGGPRGCAGSCARAPPRAGSRPPARPRRGAVNKACLWEADLPLRPARLRPPRPSSALHKPPPAGGPGDHRGNGSTSQVKLCISCVFTANADLGAQKGRDRRGRRRGGGAPGPTSRAAAAGERGAPPAPGPRAQQEGPGGRAGAPPAPPARLPALTALTSRRRGALPEAAEAHGAAPADPVPLSQGGTRARRARSPARWRAGKRLQEKVHNGAFHREPVARCQG